MSFIKKLKSKFRGDANRKKHSDPTPGASGAAASTPPQAFVSEPSSSTPRIQPDIGSITPDRNSDFKTTSPTRPRLPEISTVWNEAWDGLVKDTETAPLAQRFEGLLLEPAAGYAQADETLPDEKHEQLRLLIERQTEKIERNEWKLSFQGYDFKVKGLIEPVVAITHSARGFIGSVVEASPPASLAWAGLLLNPVEGDEARVKGLEYLSSILRQCRLREYVYQRRYESVIGASLQDDFEQAHILYRDALRMLYKRILEFEATCFVFLSGNTYKRVVKGVVKWNDWDSLMEAVKEQQNSVVHIEDNWRGLRLQEEWEANQQEHRLRLSALNAVSSEMSRMKDLIRHQQSQNDRSDLLRWLSSVADPSTNYTAAYDKLTKFTGEWILGDARFHNWMSSENSLLWLHGKAGSGKSFLSTTVIKHLKSDEISKDIDEVYNAMAYFYFDFRDPSKQTRNNLLRSLIAQISQGRPDFPEPLRRLLKFPNTNQSPSTEELQMALFSSIQDLSSVCIVLDALDECPRSGDERDLLMQCIQEIRDWRVPQLHLLVTSRREHDIALYLSSAQDHGDVWPTSDFSAEISLEACATEMGCDIETYINAQLSSKTKFGHWKPDLQRRVRLALIEKAQGMFQYVALQLEVLRHTKMSLIEAALQELPDNINKVYERALQQSPDPDVTIRALMWLAFFKPSMELEEFSFLARLMPVFHSQATEDSWESEIKIKSLYDENLDFAAPDDILRWLPGLVTVHHDEELDNDDVLVQRSLDFPAQNVSIHSSVVESHDHDEESLSYFSSDVESGDHVDFEFVSGLRSFRTFARATLGSNAVSPTMSASDVWLPKSYQYVRLCHFSLLEFLTSQHTGNHWHIDSSEAQLFIVQSQIASFLYLVDTLSSSVSKLDMSMAVHTDETLARFGVSGMLDTLTLLAALPEQSYTSRLSALIRKLFHPGLRYLSNLPESLMKSNGWHQPWTVAEASQEGPLQFLYRQLELRRLVPRLVSLMPEAVNIVDETTSDTVLSLAAYDGDEAMVKLLLDAKADPFVNGNLHSSALRACFHRGHEESRLSCARVLFDASGPDAVKRFVQNSSDGSNPLGWLTELEWHPELSPQIANIMIEQGADMTSALETATRTSDSTEAMAWLIDRGAMIISRVVRHAEESVMQVHFVQGYAGDFSSYDYGLSDIDSYIFGVHMDHKVVDKLQLLLSKGGQISYDETDGPNEPLIHEFENTSTSERYEYSAEVWNVVKRRAFRMVFRAKSCDGTYVHSPAEAYTDFERWRHVIRWLMKEKQSEWPQEVPSPSETDLELFEVWWERRHRGGWGPRGLKRSVV
ncbi:hypothetical protein PG993_007024 [Apiospora rasikravindrae]|uniref:NACHT domain-containing protein n=1 Tax=Apiospora rasikravindrae TaxID=990691 RepID=A0ABR1SYK4_9PEZI